MLYPNARKLPEGQTVDTNSGTEAEVAAKCAERGVGWYLHLHSVVQPRADAAAPEKLTACVLATSYTATLVYVQGGSECTLFTYAGSNRTFKNETGPQHVTGAGMEQAGPNWGWQVAATHDEIAALVAKEMPVRSAASTVLLSAACPPKAFLRWQNELR
jgi:hypothetical protein